jgi:WD40-like Beta Propeller Repeat
VRLRLSIVAVIAGCAAFAAVALGAQDTKTKLISRTSGGDPAAGGYSTAGGVTPNGRYVAFSSDATNLPGAGTTYNQVYLRDRKTDKTILVSRSNSGSPADGGGSYDATVSNDGRFVGFESEATNLPGSLAPTYYQAYVRDLKNDKTILVSRLSGGDPATGGYSEDASISANGRLVAFESDATNLPGGNGTTYQTYLRDRKTGKTTLLSKTNGGTPADSDSDDPAISPNGGIVGFESDASNLPGATGDDQAYVRDVKGGRTLLVSKSNSGNSGDDDSGDVTVSGNGRFVAFESYASNLPGSLGPTYTQEYVRDRKTRKTSLISRTSGGDPATGGYSENGSISSDGKLVLFESEATNLPGGTGSDYLVYLRNRDNGKTTLISNSNSGNPADDDSYVAKNSRFLASGPVRAIFYSYGSNLPGSIGPTYDQVYIREPLP